jgi:2-polyprenyl-3-methyl-5-hydroxy-6-metoxy-1,4-benzoquinol methylase
LKVFLEDIIADPETGEPLIIKDDVLFSHSNEFVFKDGVPVMLTERSVPLPSPVSLSFDYTSHYETDAIEADYFASETNAATRNEIKRVQQAILHAIPQKASLILDAGCGNGWAAKHLIPRGKKVVSMDISTGNPIRVNKEIPSENHAAVVADAFYPPFKKDCFDVIIASEIIEHVADPAAFVKSLLKVVKPGGKLIITTPYKEKIEYFLCVHCNRMTPKNAHLHSFDKSTIRNIATDLKVESCLATFNNKYMIRLHIYSLLSFLPYSLWRIKDKVINTIFGKPTRMLITLVKPS